jgi:hypothetical protein
MDERIRRILENSATFRTMKGHSESSNSMFVESSYPTFGSSNKFNHIKEFNDKLRTFDSRLPTGRKIRMTDTYGFYTPAELIDYADKKLGNLHMLQDENPIAETSLYQTEHNEQEALGMHTYTDPKYRRQGISTLLKTISANLVHTSNVLENKPTVVGVAASNISALKIMEKYLGTKSGTPHESAPAGHRPLSLYTSSNFNTAGSLQKANDLAVDYISKTLS